MGIKNNIFITYMLRYAALRFELKRVMSELYKNGERVILDYAKENVSLSSAMRIRHTTESMINTIPKGSMCALKLTSFGSRESPTQAKHHVSKLIQHAKTRGVSVCIDAEDVLYPDLCYSLMHEHNTSTYTHVYNTYQMYRRDAIDDMMRDIDRAKKEEIMIGIKLVRGAYLRKQPGVFTDKSDTDRQYNDALSEALIVPHAHTILATHNEESLQLATHFSRDKYVTAQLLGLGREPGQVDFRYVPSGSFRELAPYLLRRLWERWSWD